jgi:hypothetical protein
LISGQNLFLSQFIFSNKCKVNSDHLTHFPQYLCILRRLQQEQPVEAEISPILCRIQVDTTHAQSQLTCYIKYHTSLFGHVYELKLDKDKTTLPSITTIIYICRPTCRPWCIYPSCKCLGSEARGKMMLSLMLKTHTLRWLQNFTSHYHSPPSSTAHISLDLLLSSLV